MVPDEAVLSAGIPVDQRVIGAVAVDSIKRTGDYAEAQVAMFKSYDLIQAVRAKQKSKDSDLTSKLETAVASGRADAYVGIESSLYYLPGFEAFSYGGDAQLRNALVAEEILIDEGYPPISTRTIQVQCKSKRDFEFRYDGRGNWVLYGGAVRPGELLPFICDKAGIGQNEPAPPPPPSPEAALLQQIMKGEVLPKWKFLGINTDRSGRQYFVFFGADTIQTKEEYTDVVIANLQYHSSPTYGPSPEGVVSGFQEGRYRADSLTMAHVSCDKETIEDSGFGAKMFETQVVTYVCAHNQPRKAPKRR
jgi:hypothetical protein